MGWASYKSWIQENRRQLVIKLQQTFRKDLCNSMKIDKILIRADRMIVEPEDFFPPLLDLLHWDRPCLDLRHFPIIKWNKFPHYNWQQYPLSYGPKKRLHNIPIPKNGDIVRHIRIDYPSGDIDAFRIYCAGHRLFSKYSISITQDHLIMFLFPLVCAEYSEVVIEIQTPVPIFSESIKIYCQYVTLPQNLRSFLRQVPIIFTDNLLLINGTTVMY